MGIHKLLDWDNDDEPYLLIGLHSTVEPYKMAYLINRFLKTSFKREPRDQDVTINNYIARFPVYYFMDLAQNAKLYLIPNHCRAQIKSMSSAGSLFSLNQVEDIKTTLLKEYRTVDYFLKIEKDPEHYPIKELLYNLNRIPQVISVYQTDTAPIKNTDYLIFE